MVKKFILIFTFIGFVFLHNVTAQNCKTAQNDSIEIIFALDSWPEFSRKGTKGLINFIRNNIKTINIPDGDSKVILQFNVDTLGNTSNHKVIKSINPELDNEALRISKLMKFYKPAMQRGRPVNVVFTLPIDFKSL